MLPVFLPRLLELLFRFLQLLSFRGGLLLDSGGLGGLGRQGVGYGQVMILAKLRLAMSVISSKA